MFSFQIEKKSKRSRARLGKIKTPHGEILTPAFIPVATLGVIKGGLDFNETENTNIQCQIVNTFHFLDLGAEDIVKRAGGLHKFTRFQKPIFTDSGGFQVFSLGKGAEYGLGKIHSLAVSDAEKLPRRSEGLVQIKENGATFMSPRDGRKILLTPELSAEIQIKLGADFIYMLDICGSVIDDKKTTQSDLERTNRWFQRFLKVKIPTTQKTFAIIQGGLHKDLRLKSTEFVNNLPVFGTAIGGAFIKKDILKILSWIAKKTDTSRPHHMLGVGDIASLPDIIKLGIDLFDCALPTRIARHGTALTKSGYLDVKKAALKNHFQPLDKKCSCFACQNYSLAQLNFLFKAKEPLGGKLLTIHNLVFMENYLKKIREKIADGSF